MSELRGRIEAFLPSDWRAEPEGEGPAAEIEAWIRDLEVLHRAAAYAKRHEAERRVVAANIEAEQKGDRNPRLRRRAAGDVFWPLRKVPGSPGYRDVEAA